LQLYVDSSLILSCDKLGRLLLICWGKYSKFH